MYELRVYYEDTDTGGVVYYANYLRFFERARTEELRAWGVDIGALMNDGFFFVVTDVNLKLHSPAKYGDVLRIETKLTKVSAVTLELEYAVCREKMKLVSGWTRMACVNKELRPAKFPPDVKEKLVKNFSA